MENKSGCKTIYLLTDHGNRHLREIQIKKNKTNLYSTKFFYTYKLSFEDLKYAQRINLNLQYIYIF